MNTDANLPPKARRDEEDEDNLITPLEEDLLDEAGNAPTAEDEDLEEMSLDEPEDMNETADPIDMGADLDVPGAELDDDEEDIGEEDEENNSYSLPD